MNRRLLVVMIMLGMIGWHPTPATALDAQTQQHIQELQAQIEALEAQAQQYRNAIAGERDKASTLTRDIGILQTQISQLQVQIDAAGKKIDLTGTKISQTQDQISQAEATIDKKRETIGRMILFLNQYDSADLVTALLQHENLSSFLSQFHDVSLVQDQLLAAIEELKESKVNLEGSKSELEKQQSELQDLQDQVAQQQRQIASVKGEKAKVLKVTKGQEAAYQKQLTEIERKEAAFFQEMEKLESQVIAGGLFIVHVTATKVPPRGTKLFRRPEDGAALTQGYGMTKYAKRGAYGGAPHNGVDFASGYGTPIKAIGDGTIVAHGTNDGWGNWVAIQHPNNMVSLYGHMSTFAPLPVGASVTAGQVIGYEGNTGNVTGAHVHLSLYRDFFTYISPKNGQLYFNYFEGSLNPLDYL